MKKNYITHSFLILVSFLFLINCNTEVNTKKIDVKKKNDVENRNLYGRVKSIKIIKYNVVDKFGKLTKGEIYSNDFNIYGDKHG